MSKFYLYLDGDADGDDKLTINKAYAKRYNNWRHLEELQKLKDKYGDGVEDDDDTNSSCSEEPAVWSAEHEKDFLRTLSALKTHDLRLYSGQKFFTAEDKGTAIGNKFKKKDAPMFLKDYERKLVLEKRGDISEDEEEKKTSKHGYYEEQELIKRELKAVLAKQSDDMEPLLRQRIKAEDEVKNEEDQYYEWLKGQRDEDLPGVEELKGLKEAWNDTNLDESEKFLRDYLLNKKYDVEGDDGVPLYEEIVNVEKDEEELERENEFERKYNFRYEEPDQDFKLAGDEDLPLNVDDLEADFDPTAYDKRMKEIFSSQYYKEIVDENKEKPVFSDASDVSTDDSDYDSFEVHKERKENADNITEDCNDDEALVPEKNQVVFGNDASEEKSFEEYFNEYYALEYEDIIGDGLITKFKYRSVPANDFGITVDELLNADDRQLNAWASLKKATAYRSEAEELYDIKAYKKKALNLLKKKEFSVLISEDPGRYFCSLWKKNSNKLADNASGMEHICQMGKATAKKKRTKKSTQNCPDDVKLGERSSAVLQEGVRLLSHFKNAGSRKNHSKYEQFNSTVDINDDRLRAYGINPKKYKNKLFHRQENL
ncbi:hypothetical protein LOAG_00202 [Loa loa]|uniref:Protein KRI1 homolog n=1 Tax=Loa loa TaxID=7209 RepID=A0A1S0UBS1_LOALO|nr:hypothetical protein LOAG_00202 [Loa loa]EFO28278.1 hypothetical protein LOAG_00202 [Loa loa]